MVTAELDPDGETTMITAATATMASDATRKTTVWVRGRRRWRCEPCEWWDDCQAAAAAFEAWSMPVHSSVGTCWVSSASRRRFTDLAG